MRIFMKSKTKYLKDLNKILKLYFLSISLIYKQLFLNFGQNFKL